MHELSLVLGIVDLVQDKALEHRAKSVQSINLEIGELAGIEWAALEFAWKSAIPDTLLAEAECIIEKVEGEAECLECGSRFRASTLYEQCPECGHYLTEIRDGRQFRVKSFTVI